MPNCKNCQQNFENYPEDLAFYQKMNVPAPEICPECRQQNRLAWRNFWNLYPRQCSLTGRNIISMFGPVRGRQVINVQDWYSDKWNPLNYARDYDFSRGFFEQFNDLYQVIPHLTLFQHNSTDCDYTNLTTFAKGCYMVFGCVHDEDCMYGHIVWYCNDCFDCLYLRKCELCYQAIDCSESYNLFWCSDCSGSNHLYYCQQCKGCQNCTGCYGLINQHNHVLNQPCLNDEAYQNRSAEFLALSPAEKEKKINELKSQVPTKEYTILNSVNCVGNYIYSSKNCKDCYDVKESEDCRYGYTLEFFKDAYDITFSALPSELVYNTLTSHGRNLICCHNCFDTSNENLYYCQEINSVKDCFGCIGLHNKERFCILNKQYSEKDYLSLKDKIIQQMIERGEWGKFFPIKYSPFGYNESVVDEYYPLTKEQALAKGYNWLEIDPREYQPQSYVVPDDIKEVSDEILNQVLACTKCGRNFKIIRQELNFYRKYNLAAPKECFHCRHFARMQKRNPRRLFERQCDHCKKTIRTTYAPDRPERVYCEECYQKEIY